MSIVFMRRGGWRFLSGSCWRRGCLLEEVRTVAGTGLRAYTEEAGLSEEGDGGVAEGGGGVAG